MSMFLTLSDILLAALNNGVEITNGLQLTAKVPSILVNFKSGS